MNTICCCEKNNECIICLDKLINDKDEILILECNHLFHKRCFYNSIKNIKYKCPFRCNISINTNNCLQLISNNNMVLINRYKYIEKVVKSINIPEHIKTILNIVDWGKKDTFIAGGFALSLYKNFQIAYSDIDFMTTDINSINIDILLCENYKIEKHYTNISDEYNSFNISTNQNIYIEITNDIENVIKLKNKELNSNYVDIDIVKLQKNIFKFSLDNNIYDTLERFDLSCCKIAFTYNNDNEFIFYIHPDYYNNKAYVNTSNASKYINTMKRIEKYKNKGIKNIEVVNI